MKERDRQHIALTEAIDAVSASLDEKLKELRSALTEALKAEVNARMSEMQETIMRALIEGQRRGSTTTQ